MNKIKSLDDLRKMKSSLEGGISLREKGEQSGTLVRIRVAMATCGIAAGARDVMSALIEKIEKESMPVVVTQGGCMGYCYAEPTIEVHKPGEDPIVFGNVDVARCMEILDRYVMKGELLDGVIPANYQKV